MPLYEYQCCECHTRFEALVSIASRDKDEKDLACPQCGARQPSRLVSSFETGAASNPPRCAPRRG